jgi:D-inositol-3-phosphate glycosyltransferase
MKSQIAFISDHASPLATLGGVDSGGQNVYVAQVARQLGELGYTVDVFTRRDSPRLPEIVELGRGVRVVHVPAGRTAPVRKEALLPMMDDFTDWVMRYCEARGGYDLVHANFFMSGLVALRLKRALGMPFVITFHALGRVRRLHQGEADEFPPERIAIEEQVIAGADGIIAECPQDRADLETHYAADLGRVTVLPCGFDRKEFWPMSRGLARRALGFDPGGRLLLNVGRLVPRKGLDNIIRGLARLSHGLGLPARLVIVGGNSDLPDPFATPEIGRLQALAEHEGVARQVVFTGRRSREFLKLYYSAADLFITTPWYEPFGITPLEAMACGTPVIGSDVGGIKFSVVDRLTGRLVPPNDPEALAASIAELYRDPACLKEYGRNALRRVQAHFTWQKVARGIAGYYGQVLAAQAPRRRVAQMAYAA